jgi:hypothetical protein
VQPLRVTALIEEWATMKNRMQHQDHRERAHIPRPTPAPPPPMPPPPPPPPERKE